MTAAAAPEVSNAIQVPRLTRDIYARGDSPAGLMTSITKEEDLPKRPLTEEEKASAASGASLQGAYYGLKPHPFDMAATAIFGQANGYHSTCVLTKVNCSVGLGFVSDKVEKVLGPLASVTGLCHSFLDVLMPVADDYVVNGNGYIEVVRDGIDGPIKGIYHIEASRVRVYVEKDGHSHHYEVENAEGTTWNDKKRAKFGDTARFAKDNPEWAPKTSRIGEVIHIPRRTSLNRYYGWPDWLPAIAAVELMQMHHQDRFDFHLNRGVPEFMLFILGKKLEPADWAKVTGSLKATIGTTNAHKTIALNLTNEGGETKVQVEKLALEGTATGEDFAKMHETLALEIVSAHRIPPLLAGIVIPGKLGANNELPNALMATQALVIGPMQFRFETALDATLGNPKLNCGLGLNAGDFDLKEITDEIDLNLAATVGGMKEPLAEANANGRDLTEGMKKSDGCPLTDEERGILTGIVVDTYLHLANRRRAAA